MTNELIYQQDGIPPRRHHLVRGYVHQNFPQRWDGRTTAEDQALFRLPPRSPDLTPCNVLLMGYVKDTVFLPQNLSELRRHINAAISEIYRDMQQ